MKTQPSQLPSRREARFSPLRFAVALLICFAMLITAPVSMYGATYYWDTNGTSVGSGAATGTWGSSPFWSTDANGLLVPTLYTTTSADDVFFSAGTNGTAGTITISGAQVASSINFLNNVPLTLSGGTSLTIGGTGANSGIFVATGDNANNTISTAVILGTPGFGLDTIATNGTGVLTIGGNITGSQSLVLQNNSTAAGGITISGLVNNAGSVLNTGFGTGSVILSGGIGSNVTAIVQDAYNSGALTIGALAVNSGGTTLTNNVVSGAAGLLVVNGGVTGTGNLTLNNNNNGSLTNGIQFTAAAVNNTGTITNSGYGTSAVLMLP